MDFPVSHAAPVSDVALMYCMRYEIIVSRNHCNMAKLMAEQAPLNYCHLIYRGGSREVMWLHCDVWVDISTAANDIAHDFNTQRLAKQTIIIITLFAHKTK